MPYKNLLSLLNQVKPPLTTRLTAIKK